MVVLLVVLTITLFVFLNWVINHSADTAPVSVSETAKTTEALQLAKPSVVAGFQVQREMAYHPGHAWAFVEGPAKARVGMDDFAHRMVGEADRIDLPKPGDKVVQGEPAWVVHHGDRKAAILSPVSGEVIAVNPRAKEDAGTLAEAPYGDGWLLTVRTHSLRANMSNLLKGDFVAKWMETLVARLRMELSDGSTVTYADGGDAVPDICRLVSDDQWKGMVKEFFLTES